MLNNLDKIGKVLRSEPATSNSAASIALDRAGLARDSVVARLTAAYTNGEDSVSRPGSLRENLDGALTSLESFPVQGVITPAAAEFYARINSEYEAARGAYNTYARSISTLNTRLAGLGLRPLPPIGEER